MCRLYSKILWYHSELFYFKIFTFCSGQDYADDGGRADYADYDGEGADDETDADKDTWLPFQPWSHSERPSQELPQEWLPVDKLVVWQ